MIVVTLLPLAQCLVANRIIEPNHTGDSSPAMLAFPSIGRTRPGAGASVVVRGSRVVVGEAVAGEDGRGAVREAEGEDVCKGILVVRRLVGKVVALKKQSLVG